MGKADSEELINSNTCGLLQLIFQPLLTFRALFHIVSLCGGGHTGRGTELCFLLSELPPVTGDLMI